MDFLLPFNSNDGFDFMDPKEDYQKNKFLGHVMEIDSY